LNYLPNVESVPEGRRRSPGAHFPLGAMIGLRIFAVYRKNKHAVKPASEPTQKRGCGSKRGAEMWISTLPHRFEQTPNIWYTDLSTAAII
jgi:hypothetical protein